MAKDIDKESLQTGEKTAEGREADDGRGEQGEERMEVGGQEMVDESNITGKEGNYRK